MAWWPWETKREALARQAEAFERTVAVLREENSTLRRMLDAADRRIDSLTTEVVRSLATAAPARPALALVPPPARTSKDPIEGLGNVFAPVDFAHPDATFTDERAASLMFAEDDDGPPPAAA